MTSRKVTMNDVAKEAGVSQSSVSMILNHREDATFSAETSAKVYDAAKRLGYLKNFSPSPSTSLKIIMVLSVMTANPYYAAIQQGIEEDAYQQDYRVLVCNSYRDPKLEGEYLELALKLKVSGLVCLAYPHSPEKLSQVATQIPTICICDSDDGLLSDVIEMQHMDSGTLIIDHLTSLGHRDIAMITSSLEENRGRMAYMEGIRLQMLRHGLEEHFHVYMASKSPLAEMENLGLDYTTGYQLMQNHEVYQKGITAFICTNDSVAFGVMDALLEKNYSIPEDFSVCGCDNVLYSQFHNISLTTVDSLMRPKAKSAMSLLMRKIKLASNPYAEEQEFQQTVKYHPRLIVRGSTGPAPQNPVIG